MQHKKKLLIGSLSVSAIAAGVALTGGTSAYYYDLERSTGNTLSACSLDLQEQSATVKQTGWAQDDPSTTAIEKKSQAAIDVSSNKDSNNPGALSTITLADLQPGDAFRVDFALTNAGSCAGELWGDINFPIKDDENSILEPEAAAGDTSEGNLSNPPATPAGGGELDDLMKATYVGDDEGNTFTGTYHDLAYLNPYLEDSNFKPGEVNHIVVDLTVPDNGKAGDGNVIMGDDFTFAIDFAAAQKNKIHPRPDGAGVDLNNMPS